MNDRVYLNFGIADLEQLVEQSMSDQSVLEGVRTELGCRKKTAKRKNILLMKIDSALSILSGKTIKADFPPGWLSEDEFEKSLVGKDFLAADHVRFVVPIGCKIMVNAAIKLLTLVNQLAGAGKSVTFQFDEKYSGTQGYLRRACFFEHLDTRVNVTPKVDLGERSAHFGGSDNLVEIIAIQSDELCVEELSNRLADTLISRACNKNIKGIASGRKRLNTVVETLFSELLDNVREHSGSRLPCFAVCQIYENNVAHIAVSDSGIGILNTLRPKLHENYPNNPEYLKLRDHDLVLEMFKTGLSSRNDEGGCGLPSCAAQATKFDAVVRVRIRDSLIKIRASDREHEIDSFLKNHSLASIEGTTISFEFPLVKLDRSTST